jgi:hypothetical protein
MIFTQGVQNIQKQYSLPLNQYIPQEKSNHGSNTTTDKNAINFKALNYKKVNRCLEKVSVSEIEIDVHVGFILNVSIPRYFFLLMLYWL